MVPFTVEEENLICMYHKSDRRRTAANIRAALPDMDEDNGITSFIHFNRADE